MLCARALALHMQSGYSQLKHSQSSEKPDTRIWWLEAWGVSLFHALDSRPTAYGKSIVDAVARVVQLNSEKRQNQIVRNGLESSNCDVSLKKSRPNHLRPSSYQLIKRPRRCGGSSLKRPVAFGHFGEVTPITVKHVGPHPSINIVFGVWSI
jgi:hypothetical protein